MLRRILYEYLSKKDPRRCHSGEIGTLVRECATQEDTHRVLAKLAEEFGDGDFPLPPLPDVEQAPLEIADGALKHEASGLSTKKDSSHHYGYGSRYRDANTSDAVSALLARRGASAVASRVTRAFSGGCTMSAPRVRASDVHRIASKNGRAAPRTAVNPVPDSIPVQ